jgi:hypothetical protein
VADELLGMLQWRQEFHLYPYARVAGELKGFNLPDVISGYTVAKHL